MASTNSTTNYELSQFLGTDKPAWLSDYNGDMLKIDTQMKLNADTASGADGKADANATAIGTLSGLTTDVKTSLVGAINEVDSHADTAQSTANSANTTASGADLKAGNALTEVAKLNLTSFKTFAGNEITVTNASINGVPNITLAKDSTGSTFKLYGTLGLTSVTNSDVTITVTSGITPDSDFNIICAGIYTGNYVDTGMFYLTSPSIEVKSNGTMNIKVNASVGSNGTVRLTPCVYFAKDFGDQPE